MYAICNLSSIRAFTAGPGRMVRCGNEDDAMVLGAWIALCLLSLTGAVATLGAGAFSD